MSKHVMNKPQPQQIRAAHEAATWHERLEDGLSEAERERYLRWLQTSPRNVEAMLFLKLLVNSLRAQHKAIARH